MGKGNFTEDFKLDAIKQITELGHSVADVSKRLGVSSHFVVKFMSMDLCSGEYGRCRTSKCSYSACTNDSGPSTIRRGPSRDGFHNTHRRSSTQRSGRQ
jgi:hypothetical protein